MSSRLNKPFLLKPAAKDYLWGGNRLNTEYAKKIELTPLAETWECSTHSDGLSVVASGRFTGLPLNEVLKANPDFLGTRNNGLNELPILVKFIDANKDLSIQVHPDDAYAFKNENGQKGKTEMWYVLDAAKDAKLVYGLREDVTTDELKKSALDGSIKKYLQTIPVNKDDVFYIESGTIHAIGAGCLIAEIQESSNLTYRLYDYNRIDKNGKKRGLHLDKAVDVANTSASKEPRQPIRVLKYENGVARELLSRCKYFEVYRMIVNTERRQIVHYQSDELGFRVLLCINGCGTIGNEDFSLDVFKGDCVFVPANSEMFRIHGKMQFLDIRG
ncbi:mannose-6-phosphate isomerase [Pseudobutyrivibrio sp. 49]|uniref:type I phosphomannose isomerase catalytic subunit n=1 Tax=Pseudobutyrivibrio sp. 49 TaxID=1855344 RepID=UPI00089093D2|nr:type I phosphomannose isomerase catalytic subunit [Pseudobutyrivibrio sp. 49]SDH60183.1 mannose-6-phosphate isomerase [Pseudobutyrivibrio sp. 49]